jgi:hypothetical protein
MMGFYLPPSAMVGDAVEHAKAQAQLAALEPTPATKNGGGNSAPDALTQSLVRQMLGARLRTNPMMVAQRSAAVQGIPGMNPWAELIGRLAQAMPQPQTGGGGGGGGGTGSAGSYGAPVKIPPLSLMMSGLW